MGDQREIKKVAMQKVRNHRIMEMNEDGAQVLLENENIRI